MRIAAIVVAAGKGERAGGGPAKQYRRLAGEPVLRHSLRRLAAHSAVEAIQPVIKPEHEPDYRAAAEGFHKLLPPIAGGHTRQRSVHNGLEALADAAPEFVLVHDAARPLASAALIDRAIETAALAGAAVPALRISDTVKRVDASGMVTETLDRSALRAIQTPQGFSFARLLDAHRRAVAAGHQDFPDDAALAEWAGITVATFDGETRNLKLTTADDFVRAAAFDAATFNDIRTGSGFDVHAFCPGDHVMLGGIKIPHSKALAGHSDADVLLHALTDAILGAIAEGDIGKHFPPADAVWRGASSDRFLAHATKLVAARGGRVAHLDATIICESPKIAPHVSAMRNRIAAIVGIQSDRVSVKATTTEGLGFLGRGDGIAAMATATVCLPWTDT
jgi:2-C-methyl-D-erythritol 4-phosphate cytidylyltransferase/2-C-methyl-D-erythritol 2,4-cyclodiphosphate synthase